MKTTIIAIVGASGSGKAHLSNLLQNELNVFKIISHTTRPKHETERDGVDYYFVRKYYVDASSLLAETTFGDHHYYAFKDQVPPRGFCCCVVDENAAKTLKSKYHDKYNVVAIYVQSETETLVTRGICTTRIERDINKEHLPCDFYDYIIVNDGSVEEFENTIRETFNTIRICQHQK